MTSLKRFFPIVAVLIALVIASCGNSTSAGTTTSTTSPTPSPTSAPSPTPTPTAPSANSNALIHTATATVSGASKTVLTNAQGRTLYYFTPDTPSKSACTGSCAGIWPPLIASGTPTSSTSLPGKLTVQSAGNGNQVEYNGHLLYTYSGDTAAGQTNGEGLFGKWFVATPALQ